MTDLPYPPPFQGIATLAQHLDVSASTIDNWVKVGKLPAPRTIGGKRLWVWEEVYRTLMGPRENINLLERITNATRKASGETDHKRRVRKRDPGVPQLAEVSKPRAGDSNELPAPADAG